MPERRQIIAGNWKMHKTVAEASYYAVELLERVGAVGSPEIVVCAPFTALAALKDELEESVVHLGAQNMSWAAEGAYTGEISARMLKELACTYVILGHSERRELMHETDEEIARKVKAALEAELTPILCVGENLRQREEGRASDVVRGQVEQDLAGLGEEELRRIVIAYEPIWAIGTGKTASSQDAQEMCADIRWTVAQMSGSAASGMSILYGGSVKPENIAELMRKPDIDGALVGGASLDPAGFATLVENA
ncbi:Triose-phosphate isomerase [Acididesulfobacillus acetoxydans]|uniref:Triosephosphate isomerase n=1 Tax=Acididesulfobacillus acetoxydans TaxID=1561005 RepID=A0A8S0WVL2_9FIRM|nr:triose-phosphate isomerase [Acididesulfobacillus acetoxydans]CAA7599681.1 Triose-phosphate isomerase [Acididesulfobacillus acetoxydans]CEJ06233.1 Triosephosphate isomerase [Acididesulfobacillus acetoxydans]